MGIINTTPDSFSDGGKWLDPEVAVKHGLEMVAEGASFLDVGGESTRPGFSGVSAEEEIRRVVPVISGLVAAGCPVPISVDTTKATVAEAALCAGARIINDISSFEDTAMPEVAARHQAGCILMHRATLPEDADGVAALIEFFRERLAFAMQATGLPQEAFCIDPGIGFGKTDPQTAAILENLEEIKNSFDCPMLLAVSRKSYIARFCNSDIPPEMRLDGTLATAAYTYRGYDILRVHDVAPHWKLLNQ